MNLPHLPIARELLEAERERLLRDHYADDPSITCPGCQRAYAVAAELAVVAAECANLRRSRRGER